MDESTRIIILYLSSQIKNLQERVTRLEKEILIKKEQTESPK